MILVHPLITINIYAIGLLRSYGLPKLAPNLFPLGFPMALLFIPQSITSEGIRQ